MTSHRYDLVCVGGGLGGLTAAAIAASHGARCLVLEATNYLGGVAAYSGGTVWMPLNSLHRVLPGFDDSPEQVDAYLNYIGCDGAPYNADLRASYFERGPAVIDRLRDLGVEFYLTDAGDYYPDGPGWQPSGRTLAVETELMSLGPFAAYLRESPYDFTASRASARGHPVDGRLHRGRALTAAVARAALVHGDAQLELEARVVELGEHRDGFRRVTYEQAGHHVTVEASATLLATSGYGWAPYAAQMEGLAIYTDQAPPIAHGDGMRLAADHGAAVVRAGNGFFSVGFTSAHDVHPGTNLPLVIPMVASLAFPHCFVLNARGERFDDESFSGTFQSRLREYDDERKCFRHQPFFFVCDDQYRQNGYRPIGIDRDWPETELARADSLRELGDRLGFDGATAEATAERFNRFAEEGIDHDFGRGKQTFMEHLADDRYLNPMLGPVAQPPFWGVELVPAGAGICSHGLHIDGDARVLRWDGTPVPGLYATGNATAFAELPYGYQDGFANGRNIVYAALAVEHSLGGRTRPPRLGST